MNDPKTCKHLNTRKAGKLLMSGKERQRLQCKDCGKMISKEFEFIGR